MKAHERSAVKVCNCCKQEKPLDLFTLSRGKETRQCKDCAKLKRKAKRLIDPEHYKDELKANRDRKAGYSKDHLKQSKKEWELSNVEHTKQYRAKYYAVNKEAIAKNRSVEPRRKAVKKWQKANPEKVAVWKYKAEAKRRARKLNATVIWADNDAIGALYKEATRLTKETGIPHQVDHIIPLVGETVSGLHVHYNLQVLTARENQIKSNKFN